MSDTEAKVKITANASGVPPGMAEAVASVKEGVESINGAFESMKAAIETAMGPLIAFYALLKGGEMFDAAVDKTLELSNTAFQLSQTMGISTEKAGALNMALEDVGSSGQSFADMSQKLERQLKTNEGAMNQYGLVTRDANGHFLDATDLMMNAIQVLNEYKAGTDRNVVAQQLFGRGAGDMNNILLLTKDLLAETTERQRALGLVVGGQNVEDMLKYHESMTDVKDVVDAFEKVIGDALIPILTKMGDWFSDQGPGAVTAFRSAFVNVIEIIITAAEMFNELVLTLSAVAWTIQSVIAVAAKLITLDFKGAQAAWDEYADKVKANIESMKSSWLEAGKLVQSLDKQTAPKAKTKAETAGPGSQGSKTAGLPKVLSDYEAELSKQQEMFAEKQTAQGSFQQWSEAQTAAYWKRILGLHVLSETEQASAEKNYYTALQAVQKQDFAAYETGLKAKIAAAKNNYGEQLQYATQLADAIKQKYGENSSQYQAAEAQITKIKQAAVQQRIKIQDEINQGQQASTVHEIDMAQSAAQQKLALGQITKQQMLELEKQFEDQRYAVKAQALQNEETLLTGHQGYDPIAYQKLQEQIEQLKQQHETTMLQLTQKSVLEQNQYWLQGVRQVESAWQSSLAKMLEGQASFAQTIRSMWDDIVKTVADAVSRMIAQWMIGMLLHKEMNRKQIDSDAASGAASAYKAMAGIPIIGPVLGAAAAVLTFGAIEAYGASAAGGYDIPAGINPITQLHQREMVLPANLADRIRGMTGDGAPQTVNNFAYHDHSQNGIANEEGFTSMMRKVVRNFGYAS